MAPTVVLLHAFPLDSRLWEDVVDPLADAGWAVVVPDLRGFGESAYGEEGPEDEPSLGAMAHDVLGILDRVGVSNAVVAGISLGGYVAMELLRQDPSRVAGLALIDTKGTADTEQARANRLTVAEQVLAAGSTEALARAMLPTLLGATTHATRPGVVERVRGWILDADPRAVAWTQRAMAARPDSLADLASLAAPSLVLWGEEDETSSRAEQDLMVASLRDARLVTVPGAGHLTVVEDPAAVSAALVEFLDDVRRLPQST
ncbi:MAG: alpha/beta fold hydrolase [Frankiales bacterium]|nr:alpha/beta fold hydrolase [Frankiales bacterium]